eukprot:jgi/Picsp_1/3933/NSC_01445-R1_protein
MVQKRKHTSVGTPNKGQKGNKESSHRKLVERKSVDGETIPTQNIVGVHRISCIPWSPSSIISLSASRDGSVCACLREEGEIELYDVHSNSLIKTCPGNINASPTCMVLVDDGEDEAGPRAFVSSLDGLIVEVDTSSQQIRSTEDSYGGAVWNMCVKYDVRKAEGELQKATVMDTSGAVDSDEDVEEDEGVSTHHHLIAAACDDGAVRIYSVEKNIPGLKFEKTLPPVGGRTLSVAWHPTKPILVSGSTEGCLHVWNIDTGREVMRITVDGITNKDADSLCVWSLMVLGDGTIVSGDSQALSFWDGQFGTMIAKFAPSGSDILSIASSPKEDYVFCGGVEPKVSVFKKVQRNDGRIEWAYLSSKREHSLDIKALCVCYDRSKPMKDQINPRTIRLFSGGNDSLLVSHSVDRFLKENSKRVNIVPQRPHACSSLSGTKQAVFVATSESNKIHIWKFTAALASSFVGKVDGEKISLQGTGPVHLAELANKSGTHIIASAMSSDGKCLVFSDLYDIKCVNIIHLTSVDNNDIGSVVPIVDPQREEDLPLGLQPLKLPGDIPTSGITHLRFIPNTDSLIMVYHDGIIRIIDSLSKIQSASNEVNSVHTIRDVQGLRYKAWFKRDETKSAARRFVPLVDLIQVSNNQEHLAVSVRNRIYILLLQRRHIATQIPSFPMVEGSSIAALAFLRNDTQLAVATTGAEISIFDISTGSMCPLPGQPKDAPHLHQLGLKDSAVLGMIPSPSSPNGLLLYSAHGICHVNLDEDLWNEEEQANKMGRRPKDRGFKLDQEKAAQGRNGRVLPCADPLLQVMPLAEHQILMVQKSWDSVWTSKHALPIYRHRYGT